MRKTARQLLEVLIVGAGPTGLTAAIELARRRIPFRIIDRGAGPVAESRAAGIWPRTLEIFQRMGVLDAVLEHGQAIHQLHAYADGRPLFDIRLDRVRSPFPYLLALPQADTEALLAARLQALGGEVERRTELVRLEQDEAKAVAVLSRGDKREAVEARWVLGCDGAHSFVRKAIGLEFPGAPYQTAFALADVDVEWKQAPGEVHAFLSDRGAAVFFPFRQGKRHRVIVQLDPVASSERWRDGQVEHLDLETFEGLVRERVPVPLRLAHPIWVARFRIHHRVVSRLRVGRAFVVGDAAHVHSPVGGQGMNTGIQDAFNLAWKLALVSRGAAGAGILDTYEAERLPVAQGIVRATDWATRALTVRSRILRGARNRLLFLLTRPAGLRDAIATRASELRTRYAPGTLVGESGARARAGVRAGERAPAGKIRIGARDLSVYDWLAATEQALVFFAGTDPGRGSIPDHLAEEIARRFGKWASILTVWTRPPARKALGATQGEDADGDLHRIYGVEEPALFWIRPDGMIGYRAEPVEIDAVEAFLGRSLLLGKMPPREKGTAKGKTAKAKRA